MSTQLQRIVLLVVVLAAPWMATVYSPAAGPEQQRSGAREAAAATVARIQRADYEGDRALLRQLYAELKPAGDGTLSSRVRYWRGFALWRRAFNGFNDAVPPKELEADLEGALIEFREAARESPAFVDAKIAAISCLQTLAGLNGNNAPRVQQLVSEFQQLFKDSLDAAPDNPRLQWVLGAQQWYMARRQGAAEDPALATYEKGLQLARQQPPVKDSLDPIWGEAELLMSLAWGNLNRQKPDLQAAETYAKRALALVPYWRYVRDILMPQIREAIRKTLGGASRLAGAVEEPAQRK